MKTRFLNNPRKFNTFYLAHELGMTVEQLEATMTEAEFAEWMAFFAVKAQYDKQASEQ